jgi:hypothetical protein
MEHSFSDESPHVEIQVGAFSGGPFHIMRAMPVELTVAQLSEVSGGLNPQPLPPRWQRDRD